MSLEGLKSGISRLCCFLKALGKTPFHCPFLVSRSQFPVVVGLRFLFSCWLSAGKCSQFLNRGYPCFLAHDPLLPLFLSGLESFLPLFFIIESLRPILLPSSSTFNIIPVWMDNPVCTPISKSLTLITYAEFLLSYQVTFTGSWTLGGNIILLHTLWMYHSLTIHLLKHILFPVLGYYV